MLEYHVACKQQDLLKTVQGKQDLDFVRENPSKHQFVRHTQPTVSLTSAYRQRKSSKAASAVE